MNFVSISLIEFFHLEENEWNNFHFQFSFQQTNHLNYFFTEQYVETAQQ